MITPFDIDNLMYDILVAGEVENYVSGNIYKRNDRPQNSTKEDIVINHVSVDTSAYPQQAVSNVNCYVNDLHMNIGGVEQLKENAARLEAIADKVKDTIASARVNGLGLTITSMTVLSEDSIHQHYVNVRVSWNIQTEDYNN